MGPEVRVSVFGDSCIDNFVYGECTRLSPEAPVPVFIPKRNETNYGMALNVANNLKSLGVNCFSHTSDPYDIIKTRFVEDNLNHMILRMDQDVSSKPCKMTEDEIRSEMTALNIGAAVVSDYEKGYITREFASSVSKVYPVSFLDTKKPLGDWCRGFTFIKINKSEYEKTKSSVDEDIERRLIVTLGRDGCIYQGKTYSPPKIEHIVNVCGAGDSFFAGLVSNFMMTKDIDSAIKYSLVCATDVVRKRGVAVPFKETSNNASI